MNIWLIVILLIIISGLFLNFLVSYFNLKALAPQLPEEFEGVYDTEDYAQSQLYTIATTRFSLVSDTFSSVATLCFLLLGGFNLVDLWARSFALGPILTGLIFTGILIGLSFFLNLPFSVYSTFVIEERFGFNKTTPATFFLDILKGGALAVVLGGPLLAAILWFFQATGNLAWLFCWLGVIGFTIVIQFLAPVVILPLFNKFTPLAPGTLREKILEYADNQKFTIQGIFTMDGSKRSTKLNAFFTGFGSFRKIVFFDTLLEKLDHNEIVAVLAHEMGHFKHKHVIKMILGSIMQTGIMFYLLSLIIGNQELFKAFSMDHVSLYASLVFFGFLYSPVSLLLSILFNIISRKHEFEADKFAINTTGEKKFLISGLKKLCQANLTNLTPHPVVVFLHYSHPPILERITAIHDAEPAN